MIELFNDDSLVKLKDFKENSIDCVIIDPPYFIDGMGNNWDVEKLENKASKAKVIGSMPVGMKFDPQQGIDLQNFIEKISKEIYRILKPGGFYLCFSQARLLHRMAIGIENSGFEIRDMLIWKRENQPKAFSQDHFVRKMNIPQEEKDKIINSLQGRKTPQLKQEAEPIVLAQKPREGTFINNWMKYGVGLIDVNETLIPGKFPSTIMDVPKENSVKIKHFTVKPVALIAHLIKIFSKENDIILDCFMGSGTTGIACKETNRNFIGIELNEEYFNLAKNRIENFEESTNNKTQNITTNLHTQLSQNQQIILKVLQENPDKDFSGAELSQITGLSSRTCSGCIAPLCNAGFAVKTNNSSPFKIKLLEK